MKEKEILPVIDNIRKIMNDKKIKQSVLAEYADTSVSQMSKILNGEVQLSIKQLSNIATSLNMKIQDIFTYPDVFTKTENKQEPIDAILQIRLSGHKKEQVLSLVLGDNVLEILTK